MHTYLRGLYVMFPYCSPKNNNRKNNRYFPNAILINRFMHTELTSRRSVFLHYIRPLLYTSLMIDHTYTGAYIRRTHMSHNHADTMITRLLGGIPIFAFKYVKRDIRRLAYSFERSLSLLADDRRPWFKKCALFEHWPFGWSRSDSDREYRDYRNDRIC